MKLFFSNNGLNFNKLMLREKEVLISDEGAFGNITAETLMKSFLVLQSVWMLYSKDFIVIEYFENLRSL